VDLGASYTIYNLKVWGGNNRMYILMWNKPGVRISFSRHSPKTVE
jgi:hypothetical protein